MSQLTERDQQILSLRFGLGGEEPLTLVAIGRQINVSRQRVRQLESKAISNLKLMMAHEKPASISQNLSLCRGGHCPR